MKFRARLTGIILFLYALSLSGQPRLSGHDRPELIMVTDSILQSQVENNKIPGAVILIKKGKKVIYRKSYGYASKYDYTHNLLARPEKMTLKHMFDLASLTKAVGTTTSVMLLADKGLIAVDDPVARYIKAFDTPEKRAITIRHLLTHTAGLYEWYPTYYFASEKAESYRLIGDLPLMFPVGEQRKYSDLGYVLLGEIIETVSGLPLDEYMKENIFRPLRMKHTTFNPMTNGNYRKVASTSPGNPYEKRMVSDSTLGFMIKDIDPLSWNGWRTYVLRGEVNDGNAWYANGGVSGAAGLFSTVADIQKLVDMLINKGKVGSKQFISENTINTFLTKDRFNNGLGWMMDPANSFMRNAPDGSFGHTGFTGTSIAVIPQHRLSVILLINRQNTGLNSKGDYYNVNPIRAQVFLKCLKYIQIPAR